MFERKRQAVQPNAVPRHGEHRQPNLCFIHVPDASRYQGHLDVQT